MLMHFAETAAIVPATVASEHSSAPSWPVLALLALSLALAWRPRPDKSTKRR